METSDDGEVLGPKSTQVLIWMANILIGWEHLKKICCITCQKQAEEAATGVGEVRRKVISMTNPR